jgi:hypothetical protein
MRPVVGMGMVVVQAITSVILVGDGYRLAQRKREVTVDASVRMAVNPASVAVEPLSP